MRELNRSFREDAHAALSELDATSAARPSRGGSWGSWLALPGLRSTVCAEPTWGSRQANGKNADAAAQRRQGTSAAATAGMRKERAFVDGLANVPNANLSAHSCSVRVRKAFANCGHWWAQMAIYRNRFEAVIRPHLAKISG